MASKNLVEAEVKSMVKELLSEREDLCDCEQCQNDIIALALNNLRPRYAGSENGSVVIDSVDISSTQTKMDVYRVVINAAKAVSERPHHNRE
ncbi:late competence development ComFB family protein [Orenia marismortui]|uniref:Competence protein ComFB n=1 Tax=Orenia marismortui TaxID=46469 RepID=A0A4R8GYH4_9FIRM|nr:late competence development ComFB family protein [Orenia marismortui]TDX51566.1 competence protein ComFB [Orenia marismortui]